MILIICFILGSFSASAQISFQELAHINSATHMAFEKIKASERDILIINEAVNGNERFWWDQATTYASYSGLEIGEAIEHRVFLFGGYARLEGMTGDGVAQTICHELGHGFAGAPYKDNGSPSEGQSDYFSTKSCLKYIFKFYNQKNLVSDPYIIDFCHRNSDDQAFCERGMESIKTEIIFFTSLGDETSLSNYSQAEAIRINSSNRFYPEAQCRIDTMIHGLIGAKRPRCWFPGGIKRIL